MASSNTNGRPRQRVKKALTKPVLPALPIIAKASKIKPPPASAPVSVSHGEPCLEEAFSGDSPGSSGNIEAVDEIQETPTPAAHLQPSANTLTDLPQALEVDSPPVELDDAPPPEPIAELPDPNEQAESTTIDISSRHDGATPSIISLVSAEDTLQHTRSMPDSVNESQQWSDDTNDLSQTPTSAQLEVQDTLGDVLANGCTSTPPADFNTTDPHTNTYDRGNGADSVNHRQHSSDRNGLVNFPQANMPVTQQESRPQHYPNPTSVPRPSSGSLAISQLTPFLEHFLLLSETKQGADWVFVIQTSGHEPFVAYAHGAVLTRSQRMDGLIKQHIESGYTGNVINLHPPRTILSHPFEAALRFFYSDTVLSTEFLSPKQPTAGPRMSRTDLLEYLLSYWVSGIELGAGAIVMKSANLLMEFMGWDVTESVLKEAIELDSTCWRAGGQRAGIALDYAAMALQLKQTVLNFLSRNLNPTEFKLDVGAPTSVIRSRFADIEDSRARHNPALASMVFGSMPSSADLSPSSPQSEILPTIASSEDQATSHILLNIDFDDLSFFYLQFYATHGAAGAQLMGKIIDEREIRRLKVLSNRGVPNKQRMMNSEMWDVAGFREHVEAGFLRRDRVGFLLPTKAR